jgi:hypothetical protein
VREADVTLLADHGGPDPRILLHPNTTIRVGAWIGHRSPMFTDPEDTYRACVLDGRWKG